MAEELVRNIDNMITNLQTTEQASKFQYTIEIIAQTSRTLNLLTSNLFSYVKNLANGFRKAINALSKEINRAAKHNNQAILERAILVQRKLAEELEFVNTLQKSLQQMLSISSKFTIENPDYEENIRKAIKEKTAVQLLTAAKAVIIKLLINKETSIKTMIEQIASGN